MESGPPFLLTSSVDNSLKHLRHQIESILLHETDLRSACDAKRIEDGSFIKLSVHVTHILYDIHTQNRW